MKRVKQRAKGPPSSLAAVVHSIPTPTLQAQNSWHHQPDPPQVWRGTYHPWRAGWSRTHSPGETPGWRADTGTSPGSGGAGTGKSWMSPGCTWWWYRWRHHSARDDVIIPRGRRKMLCFSCVEQSTLAPVAGYWYHKQTAKQIERFK